MSLRRDFHAHPELSLEEERTAGVVAERLTRLGLDEVRCGVGGHGVVGVLQGGGPGPVVAWRADMDAVPLSDGLTAPYRSRVPGVKHCCGHDAHTAIGLGIAEVLAGVRRQLPGTVVFIFQPAEEPALGARAMIGAGVLDNPRPEAIFALHAFPLPVGQVGLGPGVNLPPLDDVRVALRNLLGRTTPADRQAVRERCATAVRGLSNVQLPGSVEAFDDLLAAVIRGEPQLLKAVEVGFSPQAAGVEAGGADLVGIARAAHPEERAALPARVRAVLDQVTAGTGLGYQLDWQEAVPATVNDPVLTAEVAPAAAAAVGPANLISFRAPLPVGSEDFSVFQRQLPGVLFWLGVANRAVGIAAMLHTPGFDIDEDSLVVGCRLGAGIILDYCSRHGRVI
ncbi:MAG: amidohydrolase [bacterium]|nr:amidohydrolase [bacterium]